MSQPLFYRVRKVTRARLFIARSGVKSIGFIKRYSRISTNRALNTWVQSNKDTIADSAVLLFKDAHVKIKSFKKGNQIQDFQ